MKVLFLSQGVKIDDHPGWQWSLDQLKKEGMVESYLNLPWRGVVQAQGWQAFYDTVVEEVKRSRFDIVYFHYFHAPGRVKGFISPRECISRLRQLPSSPVILTSCGDGFSDSLLFPHYPVMFREMARQADITFSTQMGRAADLMMTWGTKNIVYTPNSMCPLRFKTMHIRPKTHCFDFDVVFIGNRARFALMNPLSRNLYESWKRTKLVNTLIDQYQERLGLFGAGWGKVVACRGPVSFGELQKTFQRGRVAVGGNPFSHSDYYSSNRVFFEIASGVPTVELCVPRLDRVLRNQEHCYFCDSLEALVETCERLLKADPEMLYSRAASAADYVATHHTQYHRMKFKLDTARRYLANNRKLDVRFPFFLPEVDITQEYRFAVRSQ